MSRLLTFEVRCGNLVGFLSCVRGEARGIVFAVGGWYWYVLPGMT